MFNVKYIIIRHSTIKLRVPLKFYLFLGILTVISINSSLSLNLYSAGISNLFNTCFIVFTYNFAGKTPFTFSSFLHLFSCKF